MTELGNVFDAVAPRGDEPRGADLRVEVEVPPSGLGLAAGVEVRVPLTIDGIRRADPHGDGERLRLHLPNPLPVGAVLRLRGLGGLPHGKGAPGDLYVAVALGPEPPPARPRAAPWAIGLGLALLLGTLLGTLLVLSLVRCP